MQTFMIFAAVTLLGMIGYCLQIWSVRTTLKSGNRYSGKGKQDENGDSSSHGAHRGFSSLPPISVLKPLKGLDDRLFDNLASLCQQDYPEYEIIFSLQDHNDPAYKVAKKIKDKYPERDVTLLVERCERGLNPKVNNLIPAYAVAKHELILISDSNVMVEKDYLREVVSPMSDPETGLVSNVIKGMGGRTVGSVFENLHLNSFVLGSVCFLDKFLRMPCVVGKSMLMRKKYLEDIGGFDAVKDVLAEDYVIGKRMHEKGRKVVLSNHMIKNLNEYWGIRKFLNRHTRWGKLRWKIGGVRYFSELIGNPVFISFLSLLFCGPSKTTVALAAGISSLKIAGDFYIGSKIGNRMNSLLYLFSPLKDLMIGMVWFVPLLSSTVVWRGNRYMIGKDSVLSPYPETGIWAWSYRLVDAVKMRLA